MFKSIRKGGRIAAVTIGIVAALTPLAAPPAALADGLPTPELEKSFTVDVESEYSGAWFMNDVKYAIIYDEDSNSNTIGYSRLDLTTGEVAPISLPKSKSCGINSTLDGKRLYWRDGDKLIFFSIKDQQRTVHSLHIKKSEFLNFRVSEDGNTLTLYRDRDNDGKATKVDVFDLKSNEITFSYNLKKGEISATTSKDGKRLYVYSYRKKKSQLKVIDIPDGSTLIKEIPGNTKCNSISRVSKSDTLLIIGANSDGEDHHTYFKADYDGNIDTVADGSKIWIYDANGTLLLAQIGENDDTIVIDSETGKQISYINRNDDEDSFLSISDISRNGNIALTGASSEKSNAIRLVDTRTGQRCDYRIKSNHRCRPCLVDNDRKIAVDYTDPKDSKKLHIDVYKSNIHYSPIEKLIFFAQDNMLIVIGGGIAAVLIIIGGIAVVCIRRKKRDAAQTSTAGTTPKAKKDKRNRHKKHAQQEQVAQQSSADPAFDAQWQSSGDPLADIPQQPVVSTAPKFCRHCGTPLVPEAKFCPKCGHPVE